LYFRALSDRKRLAILQYLALHDRVAVTQLSEEFRLSQPLMSWHLRVLRRAGLVSTLRTGRQVLCSLNRDALRSYARQIDEMFGLGEDAGPQKDRSETRLPAARPVKSVQDVV
jgi:DNA-binding transcriptional ArsR family regulator